jgi:hypothetical protein
MNLIDNGISKVTNVEKVINDEEMYFLVTFVDYYGATKTKKLMSIKNLDKLTWME